MRILSMIKSGNLKSGDKLPTGGVPIISIFEGITSTGSQFEARAAVELDLVLMERASFNFYDDPVGFRLMDLEFHFFL